MKQTIYAPNTVPTANIAVNKSRLKVYKNVDTLPTYYLQKGQEFQIELANPTTDVVLAKVILNGKAISQGGLVLNPGQRIYLERYLDVAKKFLFDTYEVSGSAEMKKAIEKNGDIKVEFYKERIPYSNQFYGSLTRGFNDYNSDSPLDFLHNGSTGILRSSSNIIGGASNLTNSLSNVSYTSSNSMDNGEATLDWLGDKTNSILGDKSNSIPMKKSRSIGLTQLKSKSIETGRVEKGSDSDQEFKYVNKTFEYLPFHSIEYKMLPVSQKINTIEDVNVKVYCTNCGAKLGKTDKFCGQCGKQK